MGNCGATKTSENGALTVACTREEGHRGAHGVSAAPGLEPYVWWGDGIQWTADDERELAARHQWRKRHVRREYQTLGTWKQKQGL